jgi:hypothetical protein
MRAVLLALVVTLAAVLAGCMASAGNSEKPVPGGAMNVGFSVESAAGDPATQFHDGDTVHFVFRVHNADSAPRTLEFTFPPHRVSVFAAKVDAPVWRAFEGRMFPQVMRAQDVPVGESITFTAEWELRGVAPGIYRVQPEFIGFARPGAPLERKLAAVSIRIE